MKDDNKYLNNLVNSSGYPFQLAIEDEIKRTRQIHRWEILSREHPWQNKKDGSEGFIDLIIGKGVYRIVIECKRLKEGTWIFPVYRENQKEVDKFKSCWSYMALNRESNIGWGELSMPPSSPQSDFCILHGQDEKAKPMLERIGGFLISSVEAFGYEEILAIGNPYLDNLRLLIPCIVTSAKLKICNLKPSEISIKDGTVKNAQFKEVPYIRFRKSLEVQEIQPSSKPIGLKEIVKERERSILIINSVHLAEFLNQCELEDINILEKPWEATRA